MTAAATRRTPLLDTIETQRFGCELAGSPLYAQALLVVADDVAAEGPCARLLDLYADASLGDAVLLRFLGALHLAVLSGRAPELAVHYPSAGGTPHDGLAGALVDAVEANGDLIAAGLEQCVQTNEVGRSAALIGGYLTLAADGLPLRLREVGTSAGLNLLADQYRYEAGGSAFGPVDSPLVFREPWIPRTPDLSAPLDIADRRGCDLAPIDVTLEPDRLRLRSFVWPDQLERLTRLDAAIAVARRFPPVIDTADAVTWLQWELADRCPDVTTVVAHSITLQYLSPAERTAMVAVITEAGQRASDAAPVAWLRLEPGGDQADLYLTRWPGGETRLLATSAYHGPPVVWR
ncbi:MAG: DUF2332 domain-containing protein [Acidimicrobiales bacterium]